MYDDERLYRNGNRMEFQASSNFDALVFETFPAPLYVEPPSLRLFLSFFAIKRGSGGGGASGGGLVVYVLIDGW